MSGPVPGGPTTGLGVTVTDVTPDRYAATPTLTVALRVEEPSGDPVHALALRVQVLLEPQRRIYTDDEATRLLDLYGERPRWPQTLRPTTWATCGAVVPGFTGSTMVSLPLPCSYDLEVGVIRHLQALDGGDVALRLLFSGSVFRAGPAGLRVEPVPWSVEATHRMPLRVWRELVDLHWPDGGWLVLRRDTLRALQEHRARIGATSWDETLADLLAAAPAGGRRARELASSQMGTAGAQRPTSASEEVR